MKNLAGLILLVCGHLAVLGQSPVVEVTEQTIKIPSDSIVVMRFGFAGGDEIVLNFEELEGKELKWIAVDEYPNSSRFQEYKVSQVRDKKIAVSRNGIYEFRFANSNKVSARVCRVRIQRIPGTEKTRHFNTQVKYGMRYDTTWVPSTQVVQVGFDTTYTSKSKRVARHVDTLEVSLMDKTERVHSYTNIGGTTNAYVFFSIPEYPKSNDEEKRILAWAYWVGVGEASNEVWKENVQIIKQFVHDAAKLSFSPLGALAVGMVPELLLPKLGDNVIYYLLDTEDFNSWKANQEYRTFDRGDGIAGFKRFVHPAMMDGKYYIVLENDNLMDGIDVNVKVSIVVETKRFETVSTREMILHPRYETQIVKTPKVSPSEGWIMF